jgi:hypothetical protein
MLKRTKLLKGMSETRLKEETLKICGRTDREEGMKNIENEDNFVGQLKIRTKR